MTTHCSLLKCSGLLPAYLAVQFYLWFLFLWLFKLPIALPIPHLTTVAVDYIPQQRPLGKGFFHLRWAPLKQVLATFNILANKDKFKEIGGRTQQSTGCSCWPSCAMILNWSITSKLNYSAEPSLVQLSCWSNIFGNSHYFRNECSCVFIENRVPALSTIKEIRIQQTYSSN